MPDCPRKSCSPRWRSQALLLRSARSGTLAGTKSEANREVVQELRIAMAEIIEFYNQRRYQEGLGNVKPADVCYGPREGVSKRRQELKNDRCFKNDFSIIRRTNRIKQPATQKDKTVACQTPQGLSNALKTDMVILPRSRHDGSPSSLECRRVVCGPLVTVSKILKIERERIDLLSCCITALLLWFLIPCLSAPAFGQVSVLTAQNDNSRTGANLNETFLNTSNVNVSQFGLLYSRSLDGYLYAQPLYVASVAIPGKGTHNVVYLATLHNTVVAFDADDPSQAAPLWQVNLGPTRPFPPGYMGGFLSPEMGILSTPVIDPTTSTLYVVAATLVNGSYYHQLHALDITTGQEKFGGPVTIQASVFGTGPANLGGLVIFNSQNQLQRAGLLLANGAVYVAFASINDGGDWQGWVMAYNASNIQQQMAVYNSTPDGNGGGIWQSGRGLVTDANGYVYLMTGNGDYDGANDFGDSMVKLSPAGAITDWFTPDDQSTLALNDEDLASSGPLLIPETNLLVGGGKQGVLYLINSSNMGQFQANNAQIVQSFQATSVQFSTEIHSVTYWDRSGAPLLYLWGSNDVLKAFQFGNGTFNSTPVAQGSLSASFPGGVLAVSANGSTAGSGILWATTPSSESYNAVVAGTLRAFDASNVSSNELWDSNQNAARDSLGNFAKFALPTIANGKVYVPTFSNQFDVYGLLGLSSASVEIWIGPTSATLIAGGQQQFTATVAGTSNTAVTWSMSPSVGTLTTNGLYTAPGAISASQNITITATSVANPNASATATVTLNPGGTTGTATFVTLDMTTQGNWLGVYGSNGYNVINGTVAYPSYVTVTPSGESSTTWAASTTDVRALFSSASSTNRIAATWFSNSSFLIDLAFNDTARHQVAVYCLDWDTTSRTETITIQDLNGVVLNTQNVSSFHNGQYLVWQLSGHVQILVANTASSNNAVISGLFFDPTGAASGYTLTGPSGGALNTASSNFTVTPNNAYNGTIAITPSGGGLSSPITLTFNNSAASQTFTITPTAVGPVTLTPTNSGSLTNPPALMYATPPGAPTIGTATAGNGQATVTFTAPASTGGSAITSYTATCGSQGVSGTASPITVTGLSNGTSYTCTVTASNAVGISAPSAASNSVTPATGTSTGTATFVTLDTTTQGNWQGVYGSNGYNVINGTVAYPSYVTVTPSSANPYTWASSTTDVRALFSSASSTNRIAATWYNTSSFLIDMVFNDGLQHQVAIYCLDWDSTLRAETITIQDLNGVVLNTQNVSSFHNGQYLVWQLSGHVQILVTNKVNGENAVASGLFFQ